MFKKVDKLLIFTAIIVVIIGILAIFMSRTNVEINTKKSENMNLNYSTTESNTWDISANGDGHVTAILSEDGILTISGTGEMKDWGNGDTPDWNGIKDNVKSVIIEEGTTSIGSYAFYSCQNLTSIEIPCGMTIIGEGAFSYCKSLTSMEIPEGVTSIGESAFYSCSSLTNIVIPKGVTSIEDNAFSWCTSLTSIEIPCGMTIIGEGAFSYCKSLTSIEIPDGVTSIGKDAFCFCSSLTSIEIPDGVTSVEDNVFCFCSSLTSIEIPDGVTSIGERVFSNCSSLTSIEIPDGVTSIGEGAFSSCSSLTSIEIPASVTSIGNSAFGFCRSLTSIEIPDGVTSVGDNAFYNCSSLTSIEIPGTVTCIGTGSFFQCEHLINIEIPNSVTSIGERAFYGCTSLTSIGIPDSVTSIGESAFSNCRSLTSIEVDESNTAYMDDNGVLYTKDETEIIIYPAGKKGTEYTIFTTVINIWDGAFSNCQSLRSIKIPDGVTSIGDGAFSACSSLGSIEIPDGVTSIGNDTFSGCLRLTSIETTDGVTSIGERAFLNCQSLTSIEIPDSVTSIGERAFSVCSSLTSIVIPASVTSIGCDAFAFCTVLTIYCRSNTTVEEYAIDNNILYIIDDEAPIIESVTGNAEEWTKENVTLAINGAQDSLSGLVEKPYSFDGGETWQAENTKTYEENTSGIVIKVKDKLDNIYTHEEINITKIDKIAPTIEGITGNPSSWTNEDVTLVINATDDLSEFGESSYSFDSGETWQAGNTKTYEDNTSGIVVQVKDKAGNITTYEETIEITKIDKQAPTITKVEGNPTEWTKGNVTLTINGAEDSLSGLAEQAYSFDGGATWQAENTNTYEENTSGIVVQVKDEAGNITTYEETIEITKIDKQAPMITNVEGNVTEWTKEDVTLTINAQDSLSGLAEKPYSFDGGATWQAENTKIYTENITGIIIKVKDKLDNIYIHEEINITKIDKQVPTITSVEGNPTEWTKEDVTLTINAQDSLSGLAEKPYSFDGGATWQAENTKTYTENITGIIIKVKDKLDNIVTHDEIDIDKISELEIELETYEEKQEGNNTYITNIAPETTIEEFIENIDTNGTIEIYKGTEKITDTDTNIGTGMTVKITLNKEEKEYTVVIKGDINGDGKAKLSDLSKLKLSIIGKTELEGAYKEAADINGDGNIKLSDLSKMKLFLVGKARL